MQNEALSNIPYLLDGFETLVASMVPFCRTLAYRRAAPRGGASEVLTWARPFLVYLFWNKRALEMVPREASCVSCATARGLTLRRCIIIAGVITTVFPVV